MADCNVGNNKTLIKLDNDNMSLKKFAKIKYVLTT